MPLGICRETKRNVPYECYGKMTKSESYLITCFGANVGSVTGTLVSLTSRAGLTRNLENRVVLVEDYELIDEAMRFKPVAIVSQYGGPLCHLCAKYCGHSTKLSLGINKAEATLLSRHEGTEIQICNVLNDVSYISEPSMEHFPDDAEITLDGALWVNIWSNHIARRFSSSDVDGIGILRTELLVEDAARQMGIGPDTENAAMWDVVLTEYSNDTGFSRLLSESIFARIVSIVSLMSPKTVRVRLPDWPSDGHIANARGVARLLDHDAISFFKNLVRMLVLIRDSYPHIDVILPYVTSEYELNEVQNELRSLNWHGSVSLMFENVGLLPALESIGREDVDSIIVGLGDLTSSVLGHTREESLDLFTHPGYDKLCSLVSEIILSAKGRGLECYIGGLPNSWLSRLEQDLAGKPSGWFLRSDFDQVQAVLRRRKQYA